MMNLRIFNNKKVVITGHTGFKGSWLTLWLIKENAKIYGISNNIPTKPSLYESLNLKNKIEEDIRLDIENLHSLKKKIKKIKPDFIFHLAAQPLFTEAINNPIRTFTTNIIGTANILEILKNLKSKKCAVVIITSDKSYLNLEKKRGYKETDIIGGRDPYSSSKASAEMVIQSYLFSNLINKNINLSVARAGNVVGGGDWSKNRLIPDVMDCYFNNKILKLKNINATRPWLHVLEPIYGYMLLAKKLYSSNKLSKEAFNFGPSSKNYRVIDVVNELKKYIILNKVKILKSNKIKENTLLKLNSFKAKKKIGWVSIWNFKKTIKKTIEWYKYFYSKNKNKDYIYKKSILLINEYINNLKKH